MRIKIFSDRSLVQPGKGHVVMLYPFWGKNYEDPDDPTSGRFDKYWDKGKELFEMTSPDKADLWIFPIPWEHVMGNDEEFEKACKFIDRASSYSKKVVIFFWSDSLDYIPLDETIVFRTSIYRSRRKENEFAMPAWSEDFIAKYLNSTIPLRRKRERPVVGFCGFAYPWYPMDRILHPLKNKIKRWGRICPGIKDRPSCIEEGQSPISIRVNALKALSNHKFVDTNFLVRRKFWNGAVSPSGYVNRQKQIIARREFLKNIIQSDYVLCARGVGNFSYRLYETLSCARIPVFINTDCLLPYHFEIEWKKYCVWIEEKEIANIGEKVIKFHEGLSPNDFMDIQVECRKLWEEWLSPEGFFENFYRHFQG
jgi:hypothetical protein